MKALRDCQNSSADDDIEVRAPDRVVHPPLGMFLACSIRWMQVLQTCYGNFLHECRMRKTGHEAVRRRARPRTRRPGARSRCRTGSWPVDRQQDQGRRHESARPRRGFRTGSLAAMTLGRRLVLMRSRRRLGTTAICAELPLTTRSRRPLARGKAAIRDEHLPSHKPELA
jgi:hypothetical protein